MYSSTPTALRISKQRQKLLPKYFGDPNFIQISALDVQLCSKPYICEQLFRLNGLLHNIKITFTSLIDHFQLFKFSEVSELHIVLNKKGKKKQLQYLVGN